MPGSRYDASTKAKAVRLVREHAGDYPTQWAAITRVVAQGPAKIARRGVIHCS